jgi:hypothetical protein
MFKDNRLINLSEETQDSIALGGSMVTADFF